MEDEQAVEFLPEPEEAPVQRLTQITLPIEIWSAMEVFVYFNRRQVNV